MGRKTELLRQEYQDVLDILEPRYDLSAVGGLEPAVRELKEVADLMRRGLSSAAPMGIMLMGPPGTGKSYLAECFAKECGMLCVRFRPLRQMYVGQSERNQEKAFAAIRALAPVVVIVDESDQAEGGSRDQGSGDSGVGERMRAAAFNFWGDSALRGQGPAHRHHEPRGPHRLRHAPLRPHRHQDPHPHARRDGAAADLRGRRSASTSSRARSRTTRPFARRTAGFTGSDIELAVTTAWRFALRDAKPALDEAALTAALDDLLPTARDQRAIDRMTLLALDECRNKRLLPANHEELRREVETRLAAG